MNKLWFLALPLALMWLAGFMAGISRRGQKLAAKINRYEDRHQNREQGHGDVDRPAPIRGQPAPHLKEHTC